MYMLIPHENSQNNLVRVEALQTQSDIKQKSDYMHAYHIITNFCREPLIELKNIRLSLRPSISWPKSHVSSWIKWMGGKFLALLPNQGHHFIPFQVLYVAR